MEIIDRAVPCTLRTDPACPNAGVTMILTGALPTRRSRPVRPSRQWGVFPALSDAQVRTLMELFGGLAHAYANDAFGGEAALWLVRGPTPGGQIHAVGGRLEPRSCLDHFPAWTTAAVLVDPQLACHCHPPEGVAVSLYAMDIDGRHYCITQHHDQPQQLRGWMSSGELAETAGRTGRGATHVHETARVAWLLDTMRIIDEAAHERQTDGHQTDRS